MNELINNKSNGVIYAASHANLLIRLQPLLA